MKKLHLIFKIILAILVLVLFIFYPKKAGSSGGFSGGGDLSVKQCKCFGYHYTNSPGYPDSVQTEFCSGIRYDCKSTQIIEHTTLNKVECKSGEDCSPIIKRDELFALNKKECMQKGYEMVQIPGLCGHGNDSSDYSCGYRCDIKTNDTGKNCYSNDECEGACVCANEKDSQGFQIGKCSKHKYFTEVLDCACVLYNKSQQIPAYGCE